MAAVAAAIHAKGLKLGLYTARAPHTCAGFAASCHRERVDIAQWAAWGVDYMKDDSCGNCRAVPGGGPDVIGDYAAMQQARSVPFEYSSTRPNTHECHGETPEHWRVP